MNLNIILLILFCVAEVSGVLIAVAASHLAPDGYEDSDGFHYGPMPLLG
jgi:hypothetical protein